MDMELEYRNGAVLYTGEWKGTSRHGQGTLTLENGTVITGIFFENGKVRAWMIYDGTWG